MIDEAKSYELDRSINARMAISKQGEPIKAYSLHRNCSTPLWKVVLISLSVMLGIAMIWHLCCRHHCDED